MRKELVLVSFLIFCTFVKAQNFKFGKVSKEELQETMCSIDSSANAAILYNYRSTSFVVDNAGLRLYTNVYKRIKIYNKDGFDNATAEISLFKSGTTNESLTGLKAYTYNLNDGKIEKIELDKDQVFKNEINYNHKQVKFTMPKVKEGSVIEYKYKIISPFIWNIDDFVFQYNIPVKNEVLKLKTPNGLVFNRTSKGYVSAFPKNTSDFNSDLDMKMNVETYTLHDVPALKEEKYVDNIDNYRGGVMFELVSIQIPGTFHRHFAKSWKDVAETIGSSDDYKNKLDKTKSFNDYLDELISTAPSQFEKMKLIFKYVKDNITWNGMDGKYFYKGIKKCLKEKKGNTGDINLTLVAMLRYAGIKANPVVISTKEYVKPYFPTVDRLNSVIAYAEINDKQYFLDATEEFSDINVMPVKDYNWKGILIDNHNKIWRKIDLREPELAMSRYLVNATLNEDGSIEGKLQSKYSKHKAYEFRNKYKDKDLNDFISERESVFHDIEISDYKVENADVCDGMVSETFNYYQEEGADVINDKIYIQPYSVLKLDENPFKSEQRLFPVDFGYAFVEQSVFTIQIPKGYTLDSRPNPLILKIPSNLGEFNYNSNLIGDKLQLIVKFKINKPVIATENYLFLKQFFNQMIIKEAEQVVLTKI